MRLCQQTNKQRLIAGKNTVAEQPEEVPAESEQPEEVAESEQPEEVPAESEQPEEKVPAESEQPEEVPDQVAEGDAELEKADGGGE